MTTTLKLEKKREKIERKGRIREFVFGIQDGLISTVGLLSGMQGATADHRVVILAGFTAMLSGAISMAAGSYLSSKAEKEIFDRELRDEAQFIQEEPYLAQEGLMNVLREEGLQRETSYRLVKMLHQQKSVFVRTFQEKVLGLGSADINKPLQAAVVMAISFILGAFIPLVPYLFSAHKKMIYVSVACSAIALFGVGVFKGILAKKSWLLSGLEFFAIAVGASGVGYGIGAFLGAPASP